MPRRSRVYWSESEVDDMANTITIPAEIEGKCVFCGSVATGKPFGSWVKGTFTDLDKIHPGEIVCNGCLFFFDDASLDLASRMGKDKPQRMRNYSHFILNGQWEPLSKGNKRRMTEILCGNPFPELAVITDSGQKHIAFRATRNHQGGRSGWVQFEEQAVWVDPDALKSVLLLVHCLYTIFSKSEIETGNYSPNRIIKFGIDKWRCEEQKLKQWRGKPIFQLAIFLAQRSEGDASESGGLAGADLEGNPGGLQEQVSENNLGTVREPDTIGSLHQQHGEVSQLPLF